MQNPIAVQVVNAVQYLIQQTLDHAFRHHDRLFILFGGSVEFDDVPQVVFGIIEQEPNFSVGVWQKYPNQIDHIRMLQFTQQLKLLKK